MRHQKDNVYKVPYLRMTNWIGRKKKEKNEELPYGIYIFMYFG